mmetsp:Transcript_1133/g.1929  ORF Transcript_1133/g.1929 Transcript_1133/m.1929 type:complete len:230 (-) Transcript_1133:2478-3167(-)
MLSGVHTRVGSGNGGGRPAAQANTTTSCSSLTARMRKPLTTTTASTTTTTAITATTTTTFNTTTTTLTTTTTTDTTTTTTTTNITHIIAVVFCVHRTRDELDATVYDATPRSEIDSVSVCLPLCTVATRRLRQWQQCCWHWQLASPFLCLTNEHHHHPPGSASQCIAKIPLGQSKHQRCSFVARSLNIMGQMGRCTRTHHCLQLNEHFKPTAPNLYDCCGETADRLKMK